MQLIEELKRRNVFKVGAAYLALAWIVAQITSTIVPALNLPASLNAIVVWIGLIGFPFVLVFAWVYELTPEGLKRESEIDRTRSITPDTGKRLDRAIVALLVVAIALFALDRFIPRRAASPATAAAPLDAVPPPVSAAATTTPAASPAPAAPAQALPDDRSIAVLPFVDMSAAKDQEYMGDGIAEELLNLLAKIPELQVTSRSSAFSFKGKEMKLADVARELHVAHVLEGSVRASGNRVRITAQLIDTRSDTHLWSETYDRTLDDIFAVQDEIARAVVGQLKIKLLGDAPKTTATDPRAYALFLQARQAGYLTTAESLAQAVVLFRQALDIDPNYKEAWLGLAGIYQNQAGNGLLPADEGFARGREAIERALAIDPASAEAYARLAAIAANHDNDLPAAAKHILHGLALEPANLKLISGAATLASALGRMDASIALDEYGRDRDPVNPVTFANLGVSYATVGRYDEAIASYRTALGLSPGRIGAHRNIAVAMLGKGEAEAALAELQQETSPIWKAEGMALALHALGRKAEADAALNGLIAQYEKEMAFNIAYILAYRGEADRAFEWLDKAVQYKDPGLASIVTEHLFDNITGDPRWPAFLRRIGRAPDQLAAIEFDVKPPR